MEDAQRRQQPRRDQAPGYNGPKDSVTIVQHVIRWFANAMPIEGHKRCENVLPIIRCGPALVIIRIPGANLPRPAMHVVCRQADAFQYPRLVMDFLLDGLLPQLLFQWNRRVDLVSESFRLRLSAV